jgi:3-phosphoshikimate 1-carboxyvinyltransferase
MSPAEHDRALAWTSHLVHALAYSLTQAIDASDAEAFSCAGPSLREATRVAASAPALWRDIFLANAPAMVDVMDTFVSQLERLKQSISSGDEETILRLLEAGRSARERLEARR